MTLVKVIDSTTWAGLTEIDISESDDLSASLVNGTYRLIHSATTALVVAAVTLVSGAPASISMTAYAATVETPSAAVTVTSASPAAITMTAYGADVSAIGGASGNFTFSNIQAVNKSEGSDPASVTLAGGITEGNILVAYCAMRADSRSHTTFAVTDGNGKTWFKGDGGDNLLTDANARCSAALFWRPVESAGSEGDVTPVVTFDDNATDGGSTELKYLHVVEYAPATGGAYDWTWRAGQIVGAGTGEWDDGSNPSASPTGDDIFELAFAFGRQGPSSLPSEGGTNFATQTDGKAWAQNGANKMTFVSAFVGTSQAAGAKGADLTSDSVGCEGLVGVAAWSNG